MTRLLPVVNFEPCGRPMKKLLFIFLLLTITASTHAQWRKSLEYDLKTPLDVLPEIKKNEEPQSITVTNVSKEILVYIGSQSSPSSPQLYFEEQKDGAWVDIGWLHGCGTGMRGYSLLPGKSVDFRIPSTAQTQQRIYTLFRTEDRTKKSLVLLLETK